ncbi:MAG: ECF-type sigma factor [Bacteriovoracales bacterium]|nr:ECF-type sigma factor [Bacteriovoracales bacterium]
MKKKRKSILDRRLSFVEWDYVLRNSLSGKMEMKKVACDAYNSLKEELEKRQAKVIEMVELDNFSKTEIAKILGVSTTAIFKIHERGLLSLGKKFLESAGLTETKEKEIADEN